MPMPYYVSPEQLMRDKADYARKGIARGKSVIALEYESGILFMAENTSATLYKISEIYDRIAFAGVGKFNEFEQLRIGGIRLVDFKGYSYSREDVTAKGLANAYSQTLGNIFTSEVKPYECEILVAAVGDATSSNELFHILYDGSVTDRTGFVAMGGAVRTARHVPRGAVPEGLPGFDARSASRRDTGPRGAAVRGRGRDPRREPRGRDPRPDESPPQVPALPRRGDHPAHLILGSSPPGRVS